MKKIIFIRTIFSFFPFCSKNEKIEKKRTYRSILHNSILIRKMKKMTSVANNFSIFSLLSSGLKTVGKSVERDLILVSLIEISLDLDKKFVECEDNFAS